MSNAGNQQSRYIWFSQDFMSILYSFNLDKSIVAGILVLLLIIVIIIIIIISSCWLKGRRASVMAWFPSSVRLAICPSVG